MLSLGSADFCSITLVKLIKKSTLLKELNLEGCKNLSIEFTEDHYLPNLETLILNYANISSRSLEKLIKSATKLKQLDLKSCQNLSAELMGNLNLPSLEKLCLISSNISISSLAKVIKNSVNLKILDLSQCNKLSTELLEDLNLPSLEELNLSDSNINATSLAKILSNATSLKNLTLSECQNLSIESVEHLNLPSLEVLYLTASNINSTGLTTLISNATNLRYLNLNQCKNLSTQPLDNLNLPCLVELNLGGSNISVSDLAALIKNAAKLKILALYGCKNLSTELIGNLDLFALEKLDLDRSTISSYSLAQLIKNAAKLKILSLCECTNLADEFFEELNLASLVELDLRKSNISTSSLEKLIKNAPLLNKIILRYCTNLSEKFFEDLNLTSLVELDLSNSNISTPSLAELIKNAPSLKKLNLSNCANLSEKFFKDLNLTSIEELDLSGSNISSALLVKILSNTPNLKTLDLRNCLNLSQEITEDLSLPRLRRLFVSNAYISSTSITKITAQADKSALSIYGIDSIRSTELSEGAETRTIKQTPPDPSSVKPPKTQVQAQFPLKKPNHRVPYQRMLDADTRFLKDKVLKATKLFYSATASQDPQVNQYRIDVFQGVTLNPSFCRIEEAFHLHSEADLNLEPCLIPQHKEDTFAQCPKSNTDYDYFYSKQRIRLSREWTPLVSLSPQERMTGYHLSHDSALEIRYSQRDNRYYIRHRDTKAPTRTIDIDFIIQVPKEPALPADIQLQIKHIKRFAAKELKLTKKPRNGADYLAELIKQKVGSCRHRVVVFSQWMQEHHPEISTRIIDNDCHSFVEIQYRGQWLRANLGGYPTTLQIDSSLSPSTRAKEQTSNSEQEDAQSQALPKKIWFAKKSVQKEITPAPIYLQRLLNSETKNQLIQCKDNDTLDALRYGLQHHAHHTQRPCYYLNSPDDLICASAFIECQGTQGKPKKGPGGPLYEFLKLNAGRKPLILVNYTHFKPDDIVRCNTLLDKERLADGTPLPEDAQVFGLINPHDPQAYDGADFYSRFDKTPTVCPLPAEAFAKPVPLPLKQQGDYPEDTRVIDFFGGEHWYEQVHGTWELHGRDLRLVESVLASLKPHQRVVFKNAPWHQKEFVRFWQEA